MEWIISRNSFLYESKAAFVKALCQLAVSCLSTTHIRFCWTHCLQSDKLESPEEKLPVEQVRENTKKEACKCDSAEPGFLISFDRHAKRAQIQMYSHFRGISNILILYLFFPKDNFQQINRKPIFFCIKNSDINICDTIFRNINSRKNHSTK